MSRGRQVSSLPPARIDIPRFHRADSQHVRNTKDEPLSHSVSADWVARWPILCVTNTISSLGLDTAIPPTLSSGVDKAPASQRLFSPPFYEFPLPADLHRVLRRHALLL